jgi:hypothetical protein
MDRRPDDNTNKSVDLFEESSRTALRSLRSPASQMIGLLCYLQPNCISEIRNPGIGRGGALLTQTFSVTKIHVHAYPSAQVASPGCPPIGMVQAPSLIPVNPNFPLCRC